MDCPILIFPQYLLTYNWNYLHSTQIPSGLVTYLLAQEYTDYR
jgi:hypothetical protein